MNDPQFGPPEHQPAPQDGAETASGVPVAPAAPEPTTEAAASPLPAPPPGPPLPWEVVSQAPSFAGMAEGRPQALAEAPAALALPVPSERPSSGTKALLLALGILMLALLAVGGIAFKLWTDRIAAQQSLMAAVGAMSVTVSPEIAGTVGQRLERVKDAVDKGHFVEATSRLQHITEGTGRGPANEVQGKGPAGALPGLDFGAPPAGAKSPEAPPSGAGPQGAPQGQGQGRPQSAPPQSGQAGSGMPPAAEAFFKAEPKLAQLFGQANQAGAALRDRGGEVTKLREIRSSIIEAARLGDGQRVIKLLQDFRDEFTKQARKLGAAQPGGPGGGPRGRPPMGRPGGRPGGPPQQLMLTARRVNEAMQKARADGKDLRKPMLLLGQADQAARSGNFARAMSLSRQALEEINNSPKMAPEPELFRNPLVSMFLDLMHVEDQELGQTLAGLRESYEDAKNQTVARLSASLKQAVSVIANVGQRRQVFGKQLAQIRGGGSPAVDRKQLEAEMRKRVEATRGQIGGILGRVQGMSPADFAANREKIVDELLATVFPKPPERGGAAAKAETPGTPRPVNAGPPEQRIRAKLLQAAGPFLQVKQDPAQKELAAQLERTFGQARTLLSQGKYQEAETLADTGLALLNKGAAPMAPKAEKAGPGAK